MIWPEPVLLIHGLAFWQGWIVCSFVFIELRLQGFSSSADNHCLFFWVPNPFVLCAIAPGCCDFLLYLSMQTFSVIIWLLPYPMVISFKPSTVLATWIKGCCNNHLKHFKTSCFSSTWCTFPWKFLVLPNYAGDQLSQSVWNCAYYQWECHFNGYLWLSLIGAVNQKRKLSSNSIDNRDEYSTDNFLKLQCHSFFELHFSLSIMRF